MVDISSVDQTTPGTRWSLLQFGLICCYTVGVHVTISLPYYVSQHTEVFLVAYYVILVLICIPLCYVQIKLGAIYRRGMMGIFSHLVPILKGAAVALLLMTFIRCLVNGVELSYTIYYVFAAFGRSAANHTSKYETNYPSAYFHEEFLQRSQHIQEGGGLVWYLVLCQLAMWGITYLLTFKGFSGIGKIVYVLTPVNLVLLLVVFIYAFVSGPPDIVTFRHYTVTIVDGPNGTTIYEDDDPANTIILRGLGHPKPWIDALLLHMSSIGLWSGVLPSIGAQVYNRKFTINASLVILLVVYGVLPVCIMTSFHQFYHAGSNQGLISAANGIKPGLSYLFIGMYKTLCHIPGMALCVYTVAFIFGMMHQAIHLITIWETLLPSIPTVIMRFMRRREYLIAVACAGSFLISIAFTCRAGIYVYCIVNGYVDRLIFTLIIISIVPFIIGYIKQENMYLPVERACMSFWYGMASLIPSALLIYYFAVYVYPEPIVGYDHRWAEKLGWIIATAPITLGLILGAVHAIWKEDGSLKQRCIQALKTDSLRTTDSSNDYDPSENTTTNTGVHAPKSPSLGGNKCTKTETEIVIKPQSDVPVVQV